MKFIFTLCAILISGGAFAATSGSFLLKGNVPKNCKITVTPTAAATTLDLYSAGHSGTKVASFTSSTNSKNGMRIDISGDTAGTLVNTASATDTIAYSLDYVATTTGNNASALSVGTTAASLDSITSKGDIDGDLNINVTADANLADGDYEANVTLECVTL